ncbi:Glucose n-acetyltransferase 1, partial [Globisporangium splendens]
MCASAGSPARGSPFGALRSRAPWLTVCLLCVAALVSFHIEVTLFSAANEATSLRGHQTVAVPKTHGVALNHVSNSSGTPLQTADPESEAPVLSPSPEALAQQPPRPLYSYVLYVTSDTYACASLVLINQLRNVLNSSRDINVTILYTDAVSPSYVAKWRDSSNFGEGVHPVQVAPIKTNSGDPTWRNSLTKLRTFQHIGYDRVVFLDADSLPIRNLDHLFDLPVYLEGEVSGNEDADAKKNKVAPLFYAPKAYWLPQPFFASTVMVLTPSNATFANLMAFLDERHQSNAAPSGGDFDMDVLNAYFHKSLVQPGDSLAKEEPRAKLLSGAYVILNSDFRRPGTDKLDSLEGITVNALRDLVQVVHYSCLPDGRYGKPWAVGASELDQDDMKSVFHPFFRELYVRFREGSKAWCN